MPRRHRRGGRVRRTTVARAEESDHAIHGSSIGLAGFTTGTSEYDTEHRGRYGLGRRFRLDARRRYVHNARMPSIGRLRYLEATPPATARSRGVVVLLHAFPMNARMWEGQLALAETGWQVIAPQFRGVDGAAADPPGASVDDYAGDVVDLLDGLRIKQAVIGGLSMGGYVAFAMLRHAARYFQGLILADTKPQADTPEAMEGRKKMLALVQQKGPSAVADEMLPKLLGDTSRKTRPDVVDHVRSLILASSADAIAGEIRALMTRPDSMPLLATIHFPTLILVGEEDTVTPSTLAHEMHRAIAGSELAVIPAAGHLSNLEQPDSFNAALARFLTHRV
jgi:3-oxoadipate enol-lactonase